MTNTKPTIDEQIAHEIEQFELHAQIHGEADPMMAAKIASLQRLKKIDEVQVPLERENEALRKLLVDARKWLISNEKHSTACPTNIFNQWGRCTCGFVTTIGRIDAAIKEQSHD